MIHSNILSSSDILSLMVLSIFMSGYGAFAFAIAITPTKQKIGLYVAYIGAFLAVIICILLFLDCSLP